MARLSLAALRESLREMNRWNRLFSLPSDRASGYLSFVKPARSIYEALSARRPMRFTDPVLALRRDWSDPDPVLLGADEASANLTRLAKLARELAEERGVSPLTLGLGQVVRRDGERVRVAPLMLCPVMLSGLPQAPKLRLTGVPVGNPVLFDHLMIDPASLPPDPLDWRAEDLASPAVVALTTVAMLGLFDLARHRQWQRLDPKANPDLARHPQVLRLLAGAGDEPWPQPSRRTVTTPTRMTASLDRSQAQVIDASRLGLDLVVQGGPGTGKTQTIAHILGNAASDGRTVLFLSGRLSAFRAVLARLREGDGAVERVCLPLYGPDCEPLSLAERLGIAATETVIGTLERLEQRPHIVMATPASYALHVPQGWRFDLLVTDEASLLPLAEALPAVAACARVVICGDSEQGQKDPPLWRLLDPHTPYVAEPTLIDAAVEAGIATTVLTHHYRSRHPSLMHHANRSAYRGLMRMSISPFKDADHGLQAQRVDGSFDWASKTNAVEAEAVVDAIAAHLASGSTASLGVIAMTLQQRDLIRQRIAERGLDLTPVTCSEPVMVADYNGVQGEERDVVLLSLTFGPRRGTTAWPTSYGALSLPGGERRLTVIMTRARERMVMFASFPPESIDAARTLGHGRLLTYLLCAGRRGGDEPPRETGFMDAVASAARCRAVSFGNGFGLIDSWTNRYRGLVYVTGRIDPLTEQSEIHQYRNNGWLVVEVGSDVIAALDGNPKAQAALGDQLWRALRAAS